MKGTCILVAVLFIVSTFGTSAYPGASEVPEKEKITENMPSLDNISLFINSIPYEVGNINFGMEKNITIELALKTGNINMLLEKNQSWLENAVMDFYTINNINVSSNEMKNFFNKTNALPDGLKKAIALLIYSLNDAILASRNATKNLSSDEINFLRENNETQSDLLSLLKSAIMERMVIFPDAELFSSNADKLSMITQKIEMQKMAKASFSLFQSVRYALPEIEKYSRLYNGTVLEDPAGMIIVGGSGKDAYEGNYSLILDLGGDDSYEIKSDSSRATLILDTSGNDTYHGSIANSFLGINMLFDISGNDFYDSGNYSQSYSCAGISFLLDLNGNDSYRGGNHSQGSANAGGIAILADISGDDSYTAKNYSQGFSNGNSMSILMDISGNDIYNASGHVQGSANAGGIALLLDFLGNDAYISTKNSQGEGEGWANGMKKLSTGILADFSGNDVYRADEFSQGFGQIAGVGILADFSGNDNYFSINSSQACSKFFGIAFLLDIIGNNSYESKSFSKGYEYYGGMSVMADGVGSPLNEKLWEILQYISKNKVAPISTFLGIIEGD